MNYQKVKKEAKKPRDLTTASLDVAPNLMRHLMALKRQIPLALHVISELER